ncbi:transcriptional regulator [Geoglobus acetivorans]|uniref:Transcriptional regulator n=1 Tax=Geoglobus acetivorans TaxID=565033 RepID=A0ABZ3H3S3_GEOAI
MQLERIIALIEERPLTAREICHALEIDISREKEVYEALKKASKVLKRKGKMLLMSPPVCKKCGFEFEKMNPGRCPKCRSEWIEPARFFVEVL